MRNIAIKLTSLLLAFSVLAGGLASLPVRASSEETDGSSSLQTGGADSSVLPGESPALPEDPSQSAVPDSSNSEEPGDSSLPPGDSSLPSDGSSLPPDDGSLPPDDSSLPPDDSSLLPDDPLPPQTEAEPGEEAEVEDEEPQASPQGVDTVTLDATGAPSASHANKLDDALTKVNDGGTILVTSNILLTLPTYTVSKSVTIKSQGAAMTLSSGAVSTIEVIRPYDYSVSSPSSELTLENIVLDWGAHTASKRIVAINYLGKLTMKAGAVLKNSKGGGVYSNGTFVMEDGLITGCSASQGGGVLTTGSSSNTNPSFEMKGGEISDCSASGSGGGIFVSNVKMSGGTVTRCTAPKGSGVYFESYNKLVLSGNVRIGQSAQDNSLELSNIFGGSFAQLILAGALETGAYINVGKCTGAFARPDPNTYPTLSIHDLSAFHFSEGHWGVLHSNGTIMGCPYEVYQNGRYVQTVLIDSVSLGETAVPAQLGQSFTLATTVLPDNAVHKNVFWESDNPAVASVGSSGEVTALSLGTATITVYAADGVHTATCVVTVQSEAVAVQGITLDITEATLWTAEQFMLTATIIPSTATNKEVHWRTASGSKLVSGYVHEDSRNATVTAYKAGTAQVLAQTADGGFQAYCSITVQPKTDHMSFARPSLSLAVGEKITAKALALTYYGNEIKLKYQTSNKKVATVSSKGVITARKTGNVKIRAIAPDGTTKTLSVKVLQTPIPIQYLQLDKSAMKVACGRYYVIPGKYGPTNATGAYFKWTSSNKKIATTDAVGMVWIAKEGSVVITVSAGGLSSSIMLEATAPVMKISFAETALNLKKGTKITLKPDFTIRSGYLFTGNPKVTWASSKPQVATVNSKGVVTAKAKGSTKITVKSGNGKKAAVTIKVT